MEQDTPLNDRYYQKKLIKEIKMDDEEIYVIGIAKDKNPSDEFLLDDGTGQIHVRDIPEDQPSVENDKIYRILGRISIDGAGTQYLSVDLIKELPDFDLDIYKEALELEKKIE